MTPKLRKRPASEDTTALSNKKTRTSQEQTAPEPLPPCKLFELPAELRNKIYEYVALDSKAVLHFKRRGKLATSSALIRTARQINDEYFGMLYVTAPEIRATVKDFDFGHIITFFNTLSERELNALPTLNKPTSRKLLIRVEVTEICPAYPDSLHRWLRRCQNTTKKGTNIDVQYSLTGNRDFTRGAIRPFAWGMQPQIREPASYSPVGKVYDSLQKRIDYVADKRILTEMNKIANACLRAKAR